MFASLSGIFINFVRNFSFDDVHATGAQVIAKAAKEAGVKRLIHVSALNASEESPSKFLQSKVRNRKFSLNLPPHFGPVHLRRKFSVDDKAVCLSGQDSEVTTVNSLYCRHPWDYKLVSLIVIVHNNGNLAAVHIIGVSVIARCWQGESSLY